MYRGYRIFHDQTYQETILELLKQPVNRSTSQPKKQKQIIIYPSLVLDETIERTTTAISTVISKVKKLRPKPA